MSAARILAGALTTVALAGCGAGAGGTVMRPDGTAERRSTVSVAEALEQSAAPPLLVRGYLTDPFDDRMRLCAGLADADCSGPALVVVGLDARRVEGLEVGCCTTGYRSPHQIAVYGTVSGNVLFVPPPPR